MGSQGLEPTRPHLYMPVSTYLHLLCLLFCDTKCPPDNQGPVPFSVGGSMLTRLRCATRFQRLGARLKPFNQRPRFMSSFDRMFCLWPLLTSSASIGLQDTDLMVYETARNFAKEKMAPFAAQWDRDEVLPGFDCS